MAHVKIEMTSRTKGKVWIDGVEQQHVTAVSFQVDVGKLGQEIARVVIERTVYPESTEIVGEVDVTTLNNDGSRTFQIMNRSDA